MWVDFYSIEKIIFDNDKNWSCTVYCMNDRLRQVKSTKSQRQGMDANGSTSNEKVLVIWSKFEFHAKIKVSDEEKVDKESCKTSDQVGLNWMQSLFICVNEAKNEDVMSNDYQNVWQIVSLYLHVNNMILVCK